jgi:hypothetical protein
MLVVVIHHLPGLGLSVESMRTRSDPGGGRCCLQEVLFARSVNETGSQSLYFGAGRR